MKDGSVPDPESGPMRTKAMQTSEARGLDHITGVGTADLEAMVEPDRHRPGRARWRLRAEQIPIWAIIGHVGAIGGTTEPEKTSAETMALVADEYEVPTVAVAAAIHYYAHNRCPIDALLEENASALE